MQRKEAYKILELPESASPEEAKKKYRELTKKFHPDVNKESDAEEKFKKINEAYECIKSGKSDSPSPWGKYIHIEHINLNTTISFKESVLGTKKEISFKRKIKCQNCHGEGVYQANNGCQKCNGKGQISSKQGNFMFSRTCEKCMGKVATIPCSTCSSQGFLESLTNLDVSIPGGVSSGNILRLAGMGHYIASFLGMEQYTDTHLHITVSPDPNLKIEQMDVISTLQISLLEALKGCKKTTHTIQGEQEITINPLSRHKDEIALPNLGVNGVGFHRIILDVKYPDNLLSLLERN